MMYKEFNEGMSGKVTEYPSFSYLWNPTLNPDEGILRQKYNVNPISISSHSLHTKWGEFKVSFTIVFLQAFLPVSLNHEIILIQKTF